MEISRLAEETAAGWRWKVRVESEEWGQMELLCRRVVLATGVSRPKHLGIPGESECPNVLYSIPESLHILFVQKFP